jgi:hypothetical protein
MKFWASTLIGARCADLIAEAVQWNLKHLLKIFQECLMRIQLCEAIKEAALAATDNRALHVIS